MNRKRIGILGGTFDPPHLGHLIIAEEVRIQLDLEEIWFIPSYTPPHKHAANTSASDRIAMLRHAIAGNPFFKINPIEVERLGKSYTFDTMQALCAEHGHVDFHFIIGADMVEYLPHWNRIDALMKLVQFVGVKRTNYTLNTQYPIIEVEIPTIDISSTMVRERLAKNIPVKYLVPDSVYALIKEKHLYDNQ